MTQHPKMTLAWAVQSLETAIGKLNEGGSERRVRDQFHQLVLALERDTFLRDIQRLCVAPGVNAGEPWTNTRDEAARIFQ